MRPSQTSMCPWSFLLQFHVPRRPPSLHRVPGVGSPASSVLCSALNSCVPSRLASSPSLAGTALCPLLRSLDGRATRAPGPGDSGPAPLGRTSGGVAGSSHVPGGTPVPACRCSQTPVGPARASQSTLTDCQQVAGLPRTGQRRLPRQQAYGAQSHGLRARCLRFAVRVTPTPRKTRFRPVGYLPDGTGYPLGLPITHKSSQANHPSR